MSEEITKIIVELVFSIVGLGLLWVLKTFKAWLEQRIATKKDHELESIIYQFVNAAEQMYKEEDPTGEMRKDYVINRLHTLNIKITDLINAKIESAVFNLNRGNILSVLPVETEIASEPPVQEEK